MVSGWLAIATGIVFGYLETHALGEAFHGFAEIEPLVIHDKTQRVAAGTAAKAVVKLPLGVYRERGCFFVMERAAGAVVFARFFEFYAPINDLDDIKAIQKVIEKCLGESRHG